MEVSVVAVSYDVGTRVRTYAGTERYFPSTRGLVVEIEGKSAEKKAVYPGRTVLAAFCPTEEAFRRTPDGGP